jgi:hypothetical protein
LQRGLRPFPITLCQPDQRQRDTPVDFDPLDTGLLSKAYTLLKMACCFFQIIPLAQLLAKAHMGHARHREWPPGAGRGQLYCLPMGPGRLMELTLDFLPG